MALTPFTMDALRLDNHAVRIFIKIIFLLSIVYRSTAVEQDRTTPAVRVVTTKQQDNFYFDPAPSDTEVAEGRVTELKCNVSNRQHIKFSWMLNGKTLANTSRRYQAGSHLRIVSADRNVDVGSYRCIATNVTTGVSKQSKGAKVTVVWLDTPAEVQLRAPPDEASIKNGVDITLRCEIEGNPAPVIEWYKNKLLLYETKDVKFSRNRLRLLSVTPADNGVYSCKASNKAGDVFSANNFLLNIRGSNAAHLKESTFNRTLLVRKQGRAQFNCEYEGAIITAWYFKKRRLSNETNPRTVLYPNGTLIVDQVRERDAGIYSCVGISESGPVQTFVSELILSYIKGFTPDSFKPRQPENGPSVIPVNKNFEIACIPPEGLPTPQARWQNPKGETVRNDNVRVRVNGSRLLIENAVPGDGGLYTCVAENMAGQQRGSIEIVVSVPPTIDAARRPRPTEVEEGMTASFECGFIGSPYPITTISWYKEDKPINVYHKRYEVKPAEGILQINRVELEDRGMYSCSVNTTGHPVVRSSSAALTVKKTLKFKSPLRNAKLDLGLKGKVNCIVEGESLPIDITWSRKGHPSLPDHVTQEKNGTLHFDPVKHTDTGEYTCEAKNSQGVISKSIEITVVVRPQFRQKPVNTTAYAGRSVMFTCSVKGDPQPTVTWYKKSTNMPFDEERFKFLSNGSMYIKEVYMEDTGKYRCVAANKGGIIEEVVYLFVARPNDDEGIGMMKTVIIAVCCAVAYLGIVIGLTIYCSLRLVRAKNMRKARQAACAEKAENGDIPHEQQELMDKKERDSSFLLKSDDSRSHISGISSQPSHSSHSHSNQSNQSGLTARLPYDKYNFPRQILQNLGVIGKGVYGDVFLARMHGVRDGDQDMLVVVKSLLSRDENHHFEYRREVDMFGKLNHDNVAHLLGVAREIEPQLIITEYCEWGDLKQFLWAMKKDMGRLQNVKVPPLTVAQKVAMCNQVALGMEHLAHHRFVHKDLAARNVLLSPSLDVKITCLSLCRDVYAAEYFLFHQQMIPLRWMPAETVMEDDYSTKSDVWAFSIFCYEVFTLGDVPYRNRTNEEVLKGLKTGSLELDPMPNCPEEMMTLLAKCMADSPKDRPSFSEIALSMSEMTVDSDV